MAEEVLKPSQVHAIARTAMNMRDPTLKVSANFSGGKPCDRIVIKYGSYK